MDEIQIRRYLGNMVSESLNDEARATLSQRDNGSWSAMFGKDWQALLRNSTPESHALMKWGIERWELLQDMIHRVIRRVLVLMEFDRIGYLTIVLFLVDGSIQWRIRRESFAYPSPLAHRASLWILGGLLAVSTFGVIAPLPFLPQLTLWSILLFAWTLRTHIIHLPKRL